MPGIFKVNRGLITGPLRAPVFKKIVAGSLLRDYLSDFNFTDRPTQGAGGAMLYCLAKAAFEGDQKQKDIHKPMFEVGADEAFKKEIDTEAAKYIAHTTGTTLAGDALENATIAHLIIGNAVESRAPNWLHNFVFAAKKKALTIENVEGFFASLDYQNIKASGFVKLINLISGFYAKMHGLDVERQSVIDNEWGEYRKSIYAGGKILAALIPAFKDLGIIKGDDEKDILKAAENPWDLQLNKKVRSVLKAYGCLYLRAAGTPIDAWIQGNKEVDKLPAVKVRGALDIFRKYLEIVNETSKVTQAKTKQEIAQIATAFF